MIRAGCCEKLRKPCSYHEGWQDAVDLLGDNLAEAVELLTACHPVRHGQSSLQPQSEHERDVEAFLSRVRGGAS